MRTAAGLMVGGGLAGCGHPIGVPASLEVAWVLLRRRPSGAQVLASFKGQVTTS